MVDPYQEGAKMKLPELAPPDHVSDLELCDMPIYPYLLFHIGLFISGVGVL